MKKLLVVTTLAVVATIVSATPAFADKPDDPGIFGELVAESAQNDDGPGMSYEIEFAKGVAAALETTLGQVIHFGLHNLVGIPPKHTP